MSKWTTPGAYRVPPVLRCGDPNQAYYMGDSLLGKLCGPPVEGFLHDVLDRAARWGSTRSRLLWLRSVERRRPRV